MLLAIAIFLEFGFEEVLLSQLLAIFSIILSSYGVVKEAIKDVMNKKITANILMIIAAICFVFLSLRLSQWLYERKEF